MKFRYLDVITALFVTVLIVSNVTASKITNFWGLTLDAGTILFPLSYIIGDVLTEVYGFSRARRVIWIGFLCNILMAATFMIIGALPADVSWNNQSAYDAILGLTPRIVAASMIAYLTGEFINSFILAKLKVRTKGKHLWARTIGSTLFGQLFDTVFFITIAFWGIFPAELIIALIVSNYLFKVSIEILFTPITYTIVNWLKKKEHEDYFDKKTNFNPFALNEQK